MAEINKTSCCGFKEIDGLEGQSALQSLKEIAKDFFTDEEDAAFLFFTGVTNERYGQRFKALINKHKLGKVIETVSKKNPNSGNNIKAWIWDINKPNFRKFAKKHKITNNLERYN